MSLKIAAIKIQNLKNIELLDLELDTNFNIIAWYNGAGKTTLSEGIFMAIVWKKLMWKAPEELIKDGEKKATIELKLTDLDKQINITRTITESDVYLKACTESWQPLLQKDLDAIMWEFTIDPLAFTRLKNKEQIDFVKRIAGIDTTEIEAKYDALFNERAYINKQVKEKATLLANAWNIEIVEKKDITDLVQKRSAIIEKNNQIKTTQDRIAEGNKQIEADKSQIEELKALIAKLEDGLTDKQKLVFDLEVSLQWLGEVQDTTDLDAEIANIEAHNAKTVQYEKYKALKTDHDERVWKQDAIQKQMDDLLQEKTDMVTNANLPLPGLTFDDEIWLLIDWIPFAQKSSAEQLRISTQLAMSFDPALRVIYIKDGSLLDKNTMQMFQDMAKEKDYMLLVEVVGEDAPIWSIIMRAGTATHKE